MNRPVPRAEIEKWAATVAEKRRRMAKAEHCVRGYRDDDGVWQGGLLSFVRYFWHVLEPGTKFTEGWILEAIIEHLEAVTFGEITNLLVNVPPGCCKSLLTNVYWPAWEWGAMGLDHIRYVTFSYSSSNTERDNQRFGDLVSSVEYHAMYPNVQLRQNGMGMVSNMKHGWKLASSVTGSATGKRGNRAICDDLNNVKESESKPVMEETNRWFRESLSSRLNNMEKDAKVVIAQRVGEGDVSGEILSLGLPYCHLCYDRETEILTRDGWVRFEHLRDGIEVMGVDTHTLEGRWEMPTRYVKERHVGPMISYKSMTANLVVTPDHRMVYADSNDMKKGEPSHWRVKTAARLPRDFYLPQVIKWKGIIQANDRVFFGGETWKALDLAEYLGWYLAEGCSSVKRCTTRIVQKRDGRHVPDIERVFSAVPFKKKRRYRNSPTMDSWTIGSKPLAEALAPLGKSTTKKAPDIIKHMSPECLEAFLVAHCRGDGSQSKKSGLAMFLFTSSKQLADDLHEAAIKAGWAATITQHLNASQKGRTLNGYLLVPRLMYKVCLRRSKIAGRERKMGSKISTWNISVVPYDDFVYCVSVPSSALLVRRNGCAAVSGNCIPMEFIWQADDEGNPYTTQIGWVDPRWKPDAADCEGDLAWPARFSERAVQSLKVELGPYATASQLQQTPEARGGGIFKREWWQPGELVMTNDGQKFPPFSYIVASLDGAFTEKEENDPSALTVWGIFQNEHGYNRAMLVHAWSKKLAFSGPKVEVHPGEHDAVWRRRAMPHWGLVEWVADTCKRFKADKLLIENKASGISTAQSLRNSHGREGWSIELVEPKGDKVARALAVQPTFSQEMIYAPDREWADAVKDEMAVFPKGRHDDLVDSSSQAIKHLRDNGLLRSDEERRAQELDAVRHKGPPKAPRYPGFGRRSA